MLFIYNATDYKLSLQAIDNGNTSVSLNLAITDGKSVKTSVTILTANKTSAPKVSEALLEVYGKPYQIKHKISKRSIVVKGMAIYYDAALNEYIEIASGDRETRELHKKDSRNIVLVVTELGGTVTCDGRNLTKDPIVEKAGVEKVSIAQVTKLYIRWGNWSNLKHPITIEVKGKSGDPVYLCADVQEVESRTRPGEMYKTNILKESTEKPVDESAKKEKSKANNKGGYNKNYRNERNDNKRSNEKQSNTNQFKLSKLKGNNNIWKNNRRNSHK